LTDATDWTTGDPMRESYTELHADERTIRRVAEAELGGLSTEQSREAYQRGENPGGLHHGGKGPHAPHHGLPDLEFESEIELPLSRH
jgi:hypothetical protein